MDLYLSWSHFASPDPLQPVERAAPTICKTLGSLKKSIASQIQIMKSLKESNPYWQDVAQDKKVQQTCDLNFASWNARKIFDRERSERPERRCAIIVRELKSIRSTLEPWVRRYWQYKRGGKLHYLLEWKDIWNEERVRCSSSCEIYFHLQTYRRSEVCTWSNDHP